MELRGYNLESVPNPKCFGYPNPQICGQKIESEPKTRKSEICGYPSRIVPTAILSQGWRVLRAWEDGTEKLKSSGLVFHRQPIYKCGGENVFHQWLAIGAGGENILHFHRRSMARAGGENSFHSGPIVHCGHIL